MTTNHPQRTRSVRTRFHYYMGAMLMLLLLLGSVSYYYLDSTITIFKNSTGLIYLQMRRVVYLQDTVRQAVNPITRYALHGDTMERDLFADWKEEVADAFNDVTHLPQLTQRQSGLIVDAQRAWKQASAIGNQLLDMPFPLPEKPLQKELRRFDQLSELTVNILYQVHNITINRIRSYREEATGNYQHTLLIATIVFTTALLILVGIALSLERYIIRPLGAMKKGIDRFGQGDMAYRFAISSKDEFGEFARCFNYIADKLEKDQNELARMANHDPLTGQYNRRAFEHLLADELRRFQRYEHPVSLLMIDIDHFKRVNDSLGHLAGDEILHEVAKVIVKEVRAGDMVARYGGEEFAAILPETSLTSALSLAKRIRSAVADHPFTTHGEPVTVTISIGVANVPANAHSIKSLIGAADRALYSAKGAGRNCTRHAA